MKIPENELHAFLEEKYDQYNRSTFIASDPISIPHQFSKKQDIEIAGLLTATIAWGQRNTIISNAKKLVEMMDMQPYEFIVNATDKDLIPFQNFKHRTFNGTDCNYFLNSLQVLYKKHQSLEEVFCVKNATSTFHLIEQFRKEFFSYRPAGRTAKHVSSPAKGSSAKRLNMFMRWMVRKDKRGVDFGIWQRIPASALCMPLDVHTGSIGRKLWLLKRKQNDWKAVVELTEKLKEFDPNDPVKYDFALFGLGAVEKF